jgi:hypothetical protein
MRALLVALATLWLTSLSAVSLAAEGWQRLGRSAVSAAGVGRIVVVAPGMFGRLMLEANGAAELSNVRIEFTDDTSHAVPMPLSFSDAERSRVIPLPGGPKTIRSVVFTIRAPGGGAAQPGQTIVLYGGQT